MSLSTPTSGGNLAASYLYTNNFESYEKTKKKALVASNDHISIKRIFSKYDLLKFIQQSNKEKSKKWIGSALKIITITL